MKPFVCTMPMRLDDGWNQIQFNLADFTKRAYGTNYIETVRVQLHANCRVRRIYFADRQYTEQELPSEFKLYLPVSNTSSLDQSVEEEVFVEDTNNDGGQIGAEENVNDETAAQ